MKQTRLVDLRTMIAHPDFQGWWQALQKARAELSAARQRYDDLLSQTTLMDFRAELTQKNAIDTLYRAGELEDAAANLVAEAQQLENRSLVSVSHFEEQRFRASEAWYRLGAAERRLDERREVPASPSGDPAIKTAEKQHRLAADEYERENQKREKLWAEVESLWESSAEVSLRVSEHKIRGRKIRKEAEGLFQLAEERKVKGRELRAQAESASIAVEACETEIKRLFEEAQDRFGCAAGTEFLFFRMRDQQKQALAVSLIEDRENFNLEVMPLSIYAVDRQRGVAFLTPARVDTTSAADGDRRFEEYFLSGRKGEIRTVGA